MNKTPSTSIAISFAQAQLWVNQLLTQIKTTEANIMSALGDGLKSLGDAIDAQATVIAKVGTDLTAEIALLDGKIAAGGVTQADLDNLKALTQKVSDSATALQGIDAQITAAQ